MEQGGWGTFWRNRRGYGELGGKNSILASCEAGPEVFRGWCGAEMGIREVVGWGDVGQRWGLGRWWDGLMWGSGADVGDGVGQREIGG